MLQGKRVVVLGGTSGLGLATARAAAAEGATVVIVSGNKGRVDAALASLAGGSLSSGSSAGSLPGPSAEGYVVDLSKEEEIKAFFEKLGKFDHLVYTAGEGLSPASVGELDLGKARQFFTIRFWGAVAAVKYGHSQLNPGGTISLTSGTAGLRPRQGWSVAASICTAMEGLTRTLAVELAPIRVNVVIPGVIDTNLWSGIAEAARQDFFADEARRLPVGRVGAAEDVAMTFLYFMKQPYITGQSVVVDGGSVLV